MGETIDWLGQSAVWSGPDGIPTRLLEHLWYSGLAVLIAALIALPAGLIQGGASLLDPSLLLSGLVVALASSVIPYSLELEALRRLPPAVFGVLMSLEPAIAALAGLVILAQSLNATEVAAIVLVIAASAGAAVTARPSPPVDV